MFDFSAPEGNEIARVVDSNFQIVNATKTIQNENKKFNFQPN